MKHKKPSKTQEKTTKYIAETLRQDDFISELTQTTKYPRCSYQTRYLKN